MFGTIGVKKTCLPVFILSFLEVVPLTLTWGQGHCISQPTLELCLVYQVLVV